MIALIRYYMKLGRWKMILVVSSIVCLAVMLNDALDRLPDKGQPNNGSADNISMKGLIINERGLIIGINAPEERPHPLLRMGLSFVGMVLSVTAFVWALIFPEMSGWELDLVLPFKRNRLFAAKTIARILLLYLALLWFVPLAIMLAGSSSNAEIIVPLVNMGLLAIPVCILVTWVSTKVNIKGKPTARALLAYPLLLILVILLAAMCIGWEGKVSYLPSVGAIIGAVVIWPFASRSFDRLELSPSGQGHAEVAHSDEPAETPTRTRPGWVDRMRPLNRFMVRGLWCSWWSAVAVYVLLTCLGIVVVVFVSGSDDVPFGMAPYMTWCFAPLFVRMTYKRIQIAMAMPVPRDAIFRRILAPVLLVVCLVSGIAAVIAPLTVGRVRFDVARRREEAPRWMRSRLDIRVNASGQLFVPSPPVAGGAASEPRAITPEETAQTVCWLTRERYGAIVTPDEILTESAGNPFIDLAPVMGRLRWARVGQVVSAGLFMMLAILVPMWGPLPGRHVYSSTLWMKVILWVYRIGMLLMVAAWVVPMFLRGGHPSQFARMVVTEHFWIVAPAMLVACVLLWIRHERAFKYVDFSSAEICLKSR